MRKLPVLLLTLVALLTVCGHSAAEEQGYRVIVHKDNPADSISKQQLSHLLLKKTSRWQHGTSADPVDLDSKSPVREAFSRDVHGRSVASIKNYWQHQIFSGRGVPPPEVSGDAAVIDYVRSRPGAIGYVSPNARMDSVKVLDITGG